MSRYIDADALQEELDKTFLGNNPRGVLGFMIEAFPTADAVEVVRCKDCMHSKMADYIPAKCPYVCKLMANCHSGDFFCSMGERREDD